MAGKERREEREVRVSADESFDGWNGRLELRIVAFSKMHSLIVSEAECVTETVPAGLLMKEVVMYSRCRYLLHQQSVYEWKEEEEEEECEECEMKRVCLIDAIPLMMRVDPLSMKVKTSVNAAITDGECKGRGRRERMAGSSY